MLGNRQVSRLPATHREIGEALVGHALGVEQVTAVEYHRGLEPLLDQVEVRCLEGLPFGADDQRVGPGNTDSGVPISISLGSSG